MNETKQRIAIAEACGIIRREVYDSGAPSHWPSDRCYRPESNEDYANHVPDYLHDLNAMHEAEKVLDDPDFNYEQLLHKTTHGRGERATAAQRAEAFLRTIGKWA